MADNDFDGWEPPEDCDDADPAVNPDALDVPYNGEDEDCDGEDLVDVDLDGFDAVEAGGEDCRDLNPEVSPDAEELCNGADDDCDDEIDEDCVAEIDPGDPGGISWACSASPAPSMLALALLAVLFSRARSR